MRVTVVIPAYNGQKWIRAAVESALTQTLTEDYQVIVRDDGSTDCTWEELEKLKSEWQGEKLKIVRAETHSGLVGSFQAAFDLATTPYVTIMGQDDLIDPEYLATVLAELEANEQVGMVACHPRFIDTDGNPYNAPGDRRLDIPFPKQMETREEMKQSLKGGNRYFGINTYRRRAVVDAGGFDEKVGWLLDWDLYLRILDKWDMKVIEKPLCSLGLRDDTTSALRLDQLPQQHAYFQRVQRKSFAPKQKLKLIIATPFYMSQEFSHYGQSLLMTTKVLTQAGVDWEMITVNGDSYVDRAKNTLMANFLETDGTDVLMIDSDMQWHPNAVSRMLQHPEEIVAGAYPFKNNWGQFAGNPLVVDGKYAAWRELSDGSCLLEAYNVAGGFLRIKRSALEKFQDAYPDDVYMDDHAWPGRPGRTYTNFFKCDVVNHQRYGEDSSFSRRCREAGIKLWIDPNIGFIHYGIKGWEGNLHQHILKPPEEVARIHAEREKIEKSLRVHHSGESEPVDKAA